MVIHPRQRWSLIVQRRPCTQAARSPTPGAVWLAGRACVVCSCLCAMSPLACIQSRCFTLIDTTCRVPQDSTSKQYQQYLRPRLGDTSRLVQFLLKPAEGSSNLVTVSALRDAFEVQNELRSVRAGSGGRLVIGLQDVCWKAVDGAPCALMHDSAPFRTAIELALLLLLTRCTCVQLPALPACPTIRWGSMACMTATALSRSPCVAASHRTQPQLTLCTARCRAVPDRRLAHVLQQLQGRL